MKIELTLNNRKYAIEIEPEELLLDVLRKNSISREQSTGAVLENAEPALLS